MAPFLVAAVALALLGFWAYRRRTYGGYGAHDDARDSRDPMILGIVAALLALPLFYAALVFWSAGDRMDGLHLRYVGKRLAWGPGIPLTAGGSEDGSEDLHHPLLAPDALRIESADAEASEALAVTPGTGYLRLAAGAPVVRIDGRVANAVPLAEGDRLVLAPPGGGEELAMTFDGGALVAGDLRHELPGPFERLLRPGRVAYLPDVLADLAPAWSDGARGGYRSVLEHDDGAWRLLVRDPEVRVVRDGEELPGLDALRPVPRAFELTLQIAWGGTGQRRLRTVRTDHVWFGEETAEVRFEEPQRRRVPPEASAEAGEIGLVVPTAVDRRPELVEIDERSRRFHGLAATLRFDAREVRPTLDYLGARWEIEPGELYGLGQAADLMLLRFEAGRSPARVLADLALFGLFCAVFLGRVLRASPALAAIVAAAGVLLADRLLFAFRAATEPPHYLARSYGEARVAIWLVPALVLFGWTAAVLLRNAGRRTEAPAWQRVRAGLVPLAWPLGGLGAAALGCFATVRGPDLNNLRALALVPIVLAVVLLALYVWSSGTGSARVRRWRDAGWRWPLWALPAAGAAILVVRLLGIGAGMPEALRLPGTDFRILWSAIQLPAAALAFGLGCQLLAERDWPRGGVRDVLLGLAAAWGFVALAFGAVGWLADDRGLIIVHALAPLFALVLVVGATPAPARAADARRAVPTSGAYVLGLALAVLPLLLVLGVNRWPQPFVGAYDRLTSIGAAETADGAPAPDDAARYRASPEQQRFRLLMLANPELLSEVGLRPSEQAAVQYETMKSYAREAGFAGGGYASSELPRHLGVTYLNDLMPMAFVLADFGKLGMLGLALTYLTVLAGAAAALARSSAAAARPEAGRWERQGSWIAVVALLSFSLPGLYMILANLNLALFTGKNASLLALNSTSDVLQSGALLGLAAFGLALGRRPA